MFSSLKNFAVAAAFAALALLPSGCATSAETGRSHLAIVPESQVEQGSVLAFTDMKKQTPVSTDSAQKQQVRRVGLRIVEAARKSPDGTDLPPPEKWEFVVFKDDKTVNAFAMPGGKIGVYTGMFTVAKTDSELAVVLGHEVAHVLLKHGQERVSDALAMQYGQELGALLLGQSAMSPTTQQLIVGAYGAGAQSLALPAFSRTQESEADHNGLLYMARAGYDPNVAIEFWTKMSNLGGAAPPVFLSDHPSNQTRITDLKAEMPVALAEYKKAAKATP